MCAGGAHAAGYVENQGGTMTIGANLFDNNIADDTKGGNGGAIKQYVLNTSAPHTTVGAGATFDTNSASNYGGAIYNQDGTIELQTAHGKTTTFAGNTAGGGANDIHLAHDAAHSGDEYTAVLNITGTSGAVMFGGGISSDQSYPEDAEINMTSTGEIVFGADSVNSNFWGKFHQSQGKTTVMGDSFFSGENIIADGSKIEFQKSIRLGDDGDIATGTMRLFSRAEMYLYGGGGNFAPNTLTLNNWMSDGTGRVYLRTNGIVSDKLVITHSAMGETLINMQAAPNATPNGADIQVVDMSGITSDATFTLRGEHFDMGAYRYSLAQMADDNWYLTTRTNIGDEDNPRHVLALSPTARSVAAVPPLHLSIVKSGLNELRKRLGDLHNNQNNSELAGLWIRGYAKNLNVHKDVNAKMNLGGVEAGADLMKNALGGKIYFGLMGGLLMSGDMRVDDFDGGWANGDATVPSVGAYLTWVRDAAATGRWFVDLTARHFWVDTGIVGNGAINGYDLRRNFMAVGAEVGKVFYLGVRHPLDLSIEPKFELRYIHAGATDFITHGGDRGTFGATNGLSTHFNVQLNWLPAAVNPRWKPFVELGVYNEWLGRTDVRFAGVDLPRSDVGGLGAELSVGANANISESTYAYGAFTFETGEMYTSYLLNIGIRTKF
jgi:outer membrane autotransporter protein